MVRAVEIQLYSFRCAYCHKIEAIMILYANLLPIKMIANSAEQILDVHRLKSLQQNTIDNMNGFSEKNAKRLLNSNQKPRSLF